MPPSKKRRAARHAELEVAVVGEGVTPRDVPLREAVAILEALASLLEEAADALHLPRPKSALIAVREGSAEYALPLDEASSDAAVAHHALEAARTRGVGASRAVRKQLGRLYKATGVGAIRLAMSGAQKVGPFLLAAPKEEDDPELEEVEELHGTIVGVQAVRSEFKVRVRIAHTTRVEEFSTSDDVVADQAASLFNRRVRARVTFFRSAHEERAGEVEHVQLDEEESALLDVIGQMRDEIARRGVQVDASPFLGEKDDATDRRR